MQLYKGARKDKKIKIFQEVQTPEGLTKRYIHPKNLSIKAQVRQLSAYEQNTALALQDKSDIEFIVNYRKGILLDMLIEFKNNTYKITSIDQIYMNNTEIKLRGYIINSTVYDQVEDTLT